jgi:hypothetical protein
MESIFKMAILLIRHSEPCIFAIIKPTIFKFEIIIEDYKRINDTFGFLDSWSISSEVKLGLGPSQIKIFCIHNFLRIFPIPLKFRVDPMIYFGSLMILMIWTTKIYHWISSKLKRDRKNPQKVMKHNLKKSSFRKKVQIRTQFPSL